MKKLFLILLCLFVSVIPSSADNFLFDEEESIVVSGVQEGGACTVDNDSILINRTSTADGTSISAFLAAQIILASETQITEIWFENWDGGTDTGNLRISIYSISGGVPAEEVYILNDNVAMSGIPNSAPGGYTLTLGSAITVPAGTYALVSKEENSAVQNWRRERNDFPTDIRWASTDGVTWTPENGQSYIYTLSGCQ